MENTLKIVKLSESALETLEWAAEVPFPKDTKYIVFRENGDQLCLDEYQLWYFYGKTFDEIHGVLRITID